MPARKCIICRYRCAASAGGLLTKGQTSEIHHHRGKVYRWLRRDSDARREFETVMAGPHPLDATRLQLIRLYKWSREFSEAGRLGEEVLRAPPSARRGRGPR
jgi:hypothetical protein